MKKNMAEKGKSKEKKLEALESRERFFTKERWSTMCINLVIVIMGVFLAVFIDGRIKQCDKSKVTRIKLYNMILESNYNVETGRRMMKVFEKDSATTTFLKLPYYKSAEIAISDDNLLNVIEPYQSSLIISYIEGIRVTNKIHKEYEEYIKKCSYAVNEEGIKLRRQIRDSAASDLAMCYILQKEFWKFYNEFRLDKNRIGSLEDSIKTAKDKILRGRVKFDK